MASDCYRGAMGLFWMGWVQTRYPITEAALNHWPKRERGQAGFKLILFRWKQTIGRLRN
jgi:hypothetical protein